MAAVAGDDLDTITRRWLLDPLSMSESEWTTRPLPPGVDPLAVTYPDGAPLEGFVTSAHDLGRLGEAVLAGGRRGEVDLGLADGYLDEALHPATSLNPAYGYLWWVNGQPWHRAPRRDEPIPGPMTPNAPDDLVAVLGALGRSLYVVPSLELVVVRLGASPGDDVLTASAFASELWRLLGLAVR